MAHATAACSRADQVSGLRHCACSKKMSAPAAMLIQRLGYDAHVGNARLLHRIHHRGESAKRHVFIRTNKDGLMLRVANFLANLSRNFVDVDGVVAQKNTL